MFWIGYGVGLAAAYVSIGVVVLFFAGAKKEPTPRFRPLHELVERPKARVVVGSGISTETVDEFLERLDVLDID